jgi:hypothetical protein
MYDDEPKSEPAGSINAQTERAATSGAFFLEVIARWRRQENLGVPVRGLKRPENGAQARLPQLLESGTEAAKITSALNHVTHQGELV